MTINGNPRELRPSGKTRKVLMLGAGNSYTLHVTPQGTENDMREIVRLDLDPLCNPDVTYDLAKLHWPPRRKLKDHLVSGEPGGLQRVYDPSDFDLIHERLPFDDHTFDEIHAYEILEHFGCQGDWRGFFHEWSEYYRITKPGAYFCGSVPWWRSPWAFGDPGHTRTIQPEMFVFLSQEQYTKQIGKTPMTDYRAVYQGDWMLRGNNAGPEGPPNDRMFFMLQRGGMLMSMKHDFGPERDARRAK